MCADCTIRATVSLNPSYPQRIKFWQAVRMLKFLTKVILADDVVVFRAGLAEVLAAEPDMVVAAEAGDYKQLERAIEAHEEAVVVWAAHLQPVVANLVASVRASRGFCIVLTEPCDSGAAYLAQGVDAVVARDFSGPTLVGVIRRLLCGEAPSAPLLPSPVESSTIMPEAMCECDESFRARLTPKEIKILALVVEGCTTEQIAKRLCTLENTIKNYLRALLTTTGSSDLSELASFTVTHRVLDGEEHPLLRS
jgi:DNA-binding NarL/FixJ family response regulator